MMANQPDAPNQQVVRADGSHPSEEGTGGSRPPEPKSKGKAKAAPAAEAPPEEAAP